MKKIAKICAVLVAFTVAIIFTGCPDMSFGKDDFNGTWMTLEFDENGTRQDYYINSLNNDPYVITWFFDGRAENMFNNDGGVFWQHLVHYDYVTNNADGTYTFGPKIKETFWRGEYKIKGNSAYDKGKLYLYYECGYDMPVDGGGIPLENLKEMTIANFLDEAGLSGLTDSRLFDNTQVGSTGEDYYLNNRVTVQIREFNGKKQCSDIEYFRFNLADGSVSGYTRMMATVLDKNGKDRIGGIYNQWVGDNRNSQTGSFDGGYKVWGSSSWTQQNTRYMGRISVTSTPEEPKWLYSNTSNNSQLFKLKDTSDNTDYADPDADIRAEQ